MTLIRWTAVLVLVGCVEAPMGGEGVPGPQGPRGEPGAPGLVARSGTRLKARVAVSDDGASEFLGWWDAELAVACDFAHGRHEVMTGPERCLPLAPQTADRFADDDCTVRAVIASPSLVARAPRYCVVADGAVSRWHPIGTVADLAFRKTGDQCVPVPVTNDTVFRCGDLPEVPAETFAAFREQTPE